jgi:hypothetical protein
MVPSCLRGANRERIQLVNKRRECRLGVRPVYREKEYSVGEVKIVTLLWTSFMVKGIL